MRWSSFRSTLLTIHLWAGLVLAIPFVLLGISGSVLMFQPEMQDFYIPHAPARGAMRPIEDILAAGRAAGPEGVRASQIDLPQKPGEPAQIRFGNGRNPGHLVFVDPVSLEILGTGERIRNAPIFNVMRRLHATLYVRTISDRAFVGWLGVALTLLCLSGLVLWWPRNGQWRYAFGVKRGAKGIRFHRDLHSAVGFWMLLVLLIVSVSGVYLAFPRSFRAAVGTVLPITQTYPETAIAERPAAPGQGVLDNAVAQAVAAIPGVRPAIIQLSESPERMIVLTLTQTRFGSGAPSILATADPGTGQLLYIDDPRTYSAGERFVIWQRILHSGLGLGLVWRVVVFLSGFVPLLLAVTGLWMWLLKRAGRRVRQRQPVPAAAE